MRLALLIVIALAADARADLVQITSFGDNPGALDMFEYVPAGLPSGRPLVVVLHGCTQGAIDIAAAGWNALADAHQFAVLYPQQRAANQPLRCFDWYTTADITRDQGEDRSIIEMVDQMIADHALDPSRVFATGISAGAAFTAVLLATYPDRFAAGSVMSGVPFGCATDLLSGTACEQGVSKSPSAWGDLVRGADSGFTGPWPRVQLWQGDQDLVVAPANEAALVAQWTDVHGVAQTATEPIGVATRTTYGERVVESYLVAGMGHAISIGDDPMGACPSTAGAYFEDHKLCATLRAADFFGVLVGSGGGGGSGGSDGGSGGGGNGGGGGGGSHGSGCAAAGGDSGVLVLLAIAAVLGYRGTRWRARSSPLCRRRCRFD